MCFCSLGAFSLFYWQSFSTGHISLLIDSLIHSQASSVLSLSSWVVAALDNSDPLVCLCVLLTHTRQRIINGSDRKGICMTDNLSLLQNRASPRQTLTAGRTSNWNDISWRQQPVEARPFRSEGGEHCIIHVPSDLRALLDSIIYTLFPPWIHR